MRESPFFVLTALAGGRAHGWSLLHEIEAISNGRVRLQAGSLYATLERLQQDGLIAVDGEAIEGGRLRRYFVLTESGATRLADEAHRITENAEAATSRLQSRRLGGPVLNS